MGGKKPAVGNTNADVRKMLEEQERLLVGEIALHQEMTISIQGELDTVRSALRQLDRIEAAKTNDEAPE